MAPLVKVQGRNRVTPWVTQETKHLMEERNNMRQKAVESSLREDWDNYRALRNKCTAAVIRNRKDHWKEIYDKCQAENNVKGLYRQVKKQMGWKEAGPPTTLIKDGEIIRKPNQVANTQNNYYKQKLIDLESKLPRNMADPLATLRAAFVRWGPRANNVQSLVFQPVGIGHTVNLIKKLGVSSSAGHDGIESTTLKLVVDEIATPLNFIVNLSLSTSMFANKWKIWQGNSSAKGDRQRSKWPSFLQTCINVTSGQQDCGKDCTGATCKAHGEKQNVEQQSSRLQNEPQHHYGSRTAHGPISRSK